MATRSHIIFEDEHNQFHVRYHHWDGYPSNGLGETLQTVFNTPERIKEIFALNYNFSSITTSEKRYRQNIREGYHKEDPNANIMHGQLVNDTSVPVKKTEGYKSLKEALNECNEEYTYYFKHSEQKWYASAYNSEFIPLEHAIVLHNAGRLDFKMSRLHSEIKEKQGDASAVAKLEKKIPVLQNKIENYCHKTVKVLKKYQETMARGSIIKLMYNRHVDDIEFIQKNAKLYQVKKDYDKLQKDLPTNNNRKPKVKV